jgi:hypothetical protein
VAGKTITILVMKNTSKYMTIFAFLIAAALISVLLVLPKDLFEPEKNVFWQARYIRPASRDDDFGKMASADDLIAVQENRRDGVNLADGEIAAASLSEDFDGDGSEELVIAYRNMLVENNPIYLTYIDYDENAKQYKRVWSAPTQITRPGTISLFTKDLMGDRSVCIVLTGMNGDGEHTMAIFKISQQDENNGINKIADIKIDGTLSIIEVERTQAYQLGLTNGVSFDIRGRGRDTDSSGEFDMIEVTYSYNRNIGRYVRSDTRRVPGSQIEAARLSRLLNANATEFEQFVAGLWYRITPDATANSSQYIYFDTPGRELIFYDNNTQQVYKWLTSTSTRYGLYVSSQNISVGTLRRVMDIELEAIDTIRVKVFEDVRMKIGLSAPWDGTYRKSSSVNKTVEPQPVEAYIDAEYSTPLGMTAFMPDGSYRFELSGQVQTGRYTFFMLEGAEYLKLLPDAVNGEKRERDVYRVDRADTGGFSLRRVRLGATGVQEFREDPVMFRPPE